MLETVMVCERICENVEERKKKRKKGREGRELEYIDVAGQAESTVN